MATQNSGSRLTILLSLVAISFGFGMGCEDSGTTGAGDDCPEGEIKNLQGVCVPEDDDGTDTNVPPPVDAGPQDTEEDSSEDTSQPEPDAGCPDGCPEGQFCLEGTCREGSACTPGEVLGCADDQTRRVCPEGGVGFAEESCPNDQPNCVAGECTSNICEPGERVCDGNTLYECSSDGESRTEIETCRGGCRGGQCVSACSGNEKSYIGCNFFAVDLDNFAEYCNQDADCCDFSGCTSCSSQNICVGENANSQQYGVTVSNTGSSQVDVDIKDGNNNTVESVTIPPNSLESVGLPQYQTDNTGKTNRVYRVDANGPITVHQFNPQNQMDVFTNDASLLLPSNALGTHYLVTNWPARPNPQQLTSKTANKPYVTIVAAESGSTSVSISTPVDLQGGGGVSAISANTTTSISLNQHQVLQLAADSAGGTDMTGLEIETGGKNVAVFAGHECANIPSDTPFCDHLEQQLFPTETLGSEYMLAKFAERGTEDDYYRVMAVEDGTMISTNPSTSIDGVTLDSGEFKQFKSTQDVYLSANKPVSVSQFMVGSAYPGPDNGCNPSLGGDTSNCKVTTLCNDGSGTRIGDPAFLLNVPTSQFRDNYVFQTPEGYQEDWISVVAPQGAQVTLDGSTLSNPTSVSGQSYEIYREQVSPGVHKVTANEDVGLSAYGYECDVSYAYPGGLNLASDSQN